MIETISLISLSIGVLGLLSMIINLIHKITKNRKLVSVGSAILTIFFLGMLFIGIFIGIDDMKQTKITESFIAKIMGKTTEIKQVKKAETTVASTKEQLKNNTGDKIEQIQKESTANSQTNNTSNANKSTSNSSNNINKQSVEVNNNNQTPIELLEYKIISYENSRIKISFKVKNNSNRPLTMGKYMMTTFTENKVPVIMPRLSDNIIYMSLPEEEIKPGQVLERFLYIDNLSVAKIKMIISEAKFLDNDEIWTNPNKDNFYKTRNTY